MDNLSAAQLREQLSATREILQAISRMPTQTEALCELILSSAMRLVGCHLGAIALHEEGRRFRSVSFVGMDAAIARRWRHHRFSVPKEVFREGGPWRPMQMSADEYREVLAPADPLFASALAHFTKGRSLIIPLLSGERLLGTFHIAREDGQAFSAEQMELVRAFADHAVVALENARTLEALERHNALQSANAEILRAIGRTPDQPEAICTLILERAMTLAGTRMGHMLLYEGQRMFRTIAVIGSPAEDEAFWRGRSYYGADTMFREAGPWKPLHIPDIDAVSGPLREDPVLMSTYRRAGVRAFLYIPLVAGERIMGAFGVAKAEAGPFSPSQIEILQSFADHAVVAIDNASVLRALARQNAMQTANAEILRAISDARGDAERLFDIILRKTCEFTGTDVAGLGLHEGEGTMRFVAGRPEAWMGTFGGMTYRFNPKWLLCDGRWSSHYLPDLQTVFDTERSHDMQQYMVNHGIRSVLTMPLVSEGRLLGVFHACTRAVRTFSEEQVALLRTFASQVVIALENTRLFRELQAKNAELEQASRHKSEFLANMSHELRTPLNAIIGFSEVLKDQFFGELNDKQAEYARDIHDAGHHLLTLINDVLDLAKVEAGRMELLVEPFDLPSAVDGALIMVRERASRQGVAMSSQVDERLGRFIGDERKFKQVLLNLLSNAVKFSPAGGLVQVRAEATEEGVRVSVADQGIGIPETQQRAIFEAFHQAESTLAVKREGTGLGLTLARRFVELHGGSIGVRSQPGAGSTFTYTMREQPWPES